MKTVSDAALQAGLGTTGRMAASRTEPDAPGVPTASIVTLRRLKISLFATCVVPMVLFALFAWDERAYLLRSAESEALANVAALREHALKTIETDELLLRQLDRRIQGMDWDQIRSSSDAVSAEIGVMHAGMKQVSFMVLSDPEGRVWAATPPHRTGGFVPTSNLDIWPAQRAADQGTFFSRPYVSKMTGRVNFDISRRRSVPDNRFDGTLHLGVDVSYFSTFWSEVTAGKEGATVALLRTDGEFLARVPDMGRPLPGLLLQSSALLRYLAAGSREGVFHVTSVIDGTDLVYAYARVGTHPLVVGYGLSEHAVLAPWRQHLLLFGGFGFVAAIATAMAVLAAIRQVHQVIDEQGRRAMIEAAAQNGQRLELLGRLAAESAHDFANILQAMSAAATLIRRSVANPERVRSLTDRLDEDVERGTSLTRTMLDVIRPGGGVLGCPSNQSDVVIELTGAMTRVGDRLRRLLGGAYRLRWEIDPPCVPARLRDDRSELELVIMNLVVNARDAMPDGGEVLIQATVEQIGDRKRRRRAADLRPGLYVRISVIDGGVGMTPEVLARAGELFFTTKSPDKGTGLGLSGARGFADRAGGRLTIESELGRGTTVTLWLPVIDPVQVDSPALVRTLA